MEKEKKESKNYMKIPSENVGLTIPQTYTYAILQETSGGEQESWLYFLRYQGNEEALLHLEKQLTQVRWRIVEEMSTFDLELKFLVSESTAKEMTKVDLNAYSFHRKFDGKLKMIDLKLKDSYKNQKKIEKVNDVLGYGGIEQFIDREDIDPEDLRKDEGDESSTASSDENGSESSSESESEDDSEDKKRSQKKGTKHEIPKFARVKAGRHKK